MKKNYQVITVIGILLLLIGGVLIFSNHEQSQAHGELEPLKVTILKVGKADAIVVQTEEKTMVIDAGEEEDGEELELFLKQQYVSCIDTLIITHFDQDHVGGADTLVENLEIGQVLLPDYEGSNTEYMDFMTALEKKGIKPERLTAPVELKLGQTEVLVEPPTSYPVETGASEMDNNFSLVTTVVHGKNHLLFTGDIEKQRIREWLSGREKEKIQFLKVPHHGVYNTALKELLQMTNPECAVICSSNKNPADVQTLEVLKEYNVQIFQTKDGNVTAISDGKNLELSQELEE
jgi:metallo-beta-lactamase family protein